ncbi:hypothetical protein U3P88_07265 [Bacillus velezensis]|uniref:hypothetical protein n=1 Tax=Bacillus amyloliquefaciens group TaxID=1938374 RepID=UPI00130EBB4E|nr:hypothetical protein [Bacillus amyloliquefaciens]
MTEEGRILMYEAPGLGAFLFYIGPVLGVGIFFLEKAVPEMPFHPWKYCFYK